MDCWQSLEESDIHFRDCLVPHFRGLCLVVLETVLVPNIRCLSRCWLVVTSQHLLLISSEVPDSCCLARCLTVTFLDPNIRCHVPAEPLFRSLQGLAEPGATEVVNSHPAAVAPSAMERLPPLLHLLRPHRLQKFPAFSVTSAALELQLLEVEEEVQREVGHPVSLDRTCISIVVQDFFGPSRLPSVFLQQASLRDWAACVAKRPYPKHYPHTPLYIIINYTNK